MSEGGADLDLVAWWGAVVATVVAAVQLYDRAFNRPVPHTTSLFTGSEHVGNQIAIINAHSAPLIITDWSIYWAKVDGFNMCRGPSVAESDFEDLAVITLAPHGHTTLHFADQNYFGWGARYVNRGQLYLELKVVGRQRPVILHIHNPSPAEYREPKSARRCLPHAWRPRPTRKPEDEPLAL